MAFTLKSGNSPKFKNLGSTPAKNMKTGSYAHKFENGSSNTPAYLKQFGIGKGTSPSPLDFDATGKSEADIKAEQTRLGVAADGIWGPKSQAAFDAAAEKKNDKEVEVTKTDGDAITENIVKPPKVNKSKTIASKIGNTLVGAFTGGISKVYGGNAVVAGNELKFHDPKDKDKKTCKDADGNVVGCDSPNAVK
jgi:hypothetical protein